MVRLLFCVALFVISSVTSAQNFVKHKKIWYEPSFEIANSLAINSNSINLFLIETLHSAVIRMYQDSRSSVAFGIGAGFMSYSGIVKPVDIVSDLVISPNDVNVSRKSPYLRCAVIIRLAEIRKIRDVVVPYFSFNYYKLFLKNNMESFYMNVEYPEVPNVVLQHPGFLFLGDNFEGLEIGVELKSKNRARFYTGLSLTSTSIGGNSKTHEEIKVSFDENPEQTHHLSYSLSSANIAYCVKVGVRL